MNQLASSRSRNRPQERLSRVRTGGTTNWRSTGSMLLGAAVGGVAMYKGHVMTGALMMVGGMIGGSLLEGKDA